MVFRGGLGFWLVGESACFLFFSFFSLLFFFLFGREGRRGIKKKGERERERVGVLPGRKWVDVVVETAMGMEATRRAGAKTPRGAAHRRGWGRKGGRGKRQRSVGGCAETERQCFQPLRESWLLKKKWIG